MKKLSRLSLAGVLAFLLSGCLVEYEAVIKPDPKVDSRLEGVWQIMEKKPEEIKTDRDDMDNLGIQGYLVLGKLDDATLRAVLIDHFEKDREAGIGEYLVSSREYKGHTFLMVTPPREDQKKKPGGVAGKNCLADYEIDKEGHLFVRFLYIEDFAKAIQVHPMKYKQPRGDFAPIILRGSEEEILDFYADPKVRALFTSGGKYQKLQVPAK